MATKTRAQLKALFTNGSEIVESSFTDLIDTLIPEGGSTGSLANAIQTTHGVASAAGAVQVGTGTNSVGTSVKVGDGIRIIGGTGTTPSRKGDIGINAGGTILFYTDALYQLPDPNWWLAGPGP
jgi:hypothetical protein